MLLLLTVAVAAMLNKLSRLITHSSATFLNITNKQVEFTILKSLSSQSKGNLAARKNPLIMKLNTDTPEFKAMLTPEVQALESVFKKYGYELRIVGGAVRDLLMEQRPGDIDFATVATPEQMKKMFNAENIRMINMNGESHGTITPRINDKENFEVTTLRIDTSTHGRSATVEFTTDWKLDALRRDLTINSMFLGFDGTVYDYFNGYEDLKNRRVLFVGNAEDRIKEDYLRILRYFRFFGRVADDPNNHDKETLEVIKLNMDGLSILSGERIWSEVRKILIGNFRTEIFVTMLDIGLGPFLGLPDDADKTKFEVVSNRCKNVDVNPITLLSSLLKTEEEAINLNKRLKLSAFERDLSLVIVLHRDLKLRPEKPLIPFFKNIVNGFGSATNTPQKSRKWCVEILRYRGELALADELEKFKIPWFPISGKDIIKDFNLIPGRHFNMIISELKDYWIENDFKPTKEELTARMPSILERCEINNPSKTKRPAKKQKT